MESCKSEVLRDYEESGYHHWEGFGGVSFLHWCCGMPMRVIKRYRRENRTGKADTADNHWYCGVCDTRHAPMSICD